MEKLPNNHYHKLILASLIMLALFLTLALPSVMLAQNPSAPLSPASENYGLDKTVETAKDLNTGERDLSQIAGTFINYVLGIVGTIFLLVILVGGYKWMTAGGAEEKIADGKKMIMSGVNGMIAIFLAYALAFAIIYGLSQAIQ